jgi:hypothetical protein
MRCHIRQTIAACPNDFAMVKERNAHAWDVVILHPIGERHRRERLSLDDRGGQQSVLYPIDS